MRAKFEIKPAPELDLLARLWRDLESRAHAPVFLTWGWIGAWVAEIGFTPPLLIGRVDGRIALLGLIVPARRQDVPLLATNGFRLHTTGDESLDVITIEYNNFLVDRECGELLEDAAIRFLLGGVAIGGVRYDEVHLKNTTRDFIQACQGFAVTRSILSRKPSYRIDLEAVRGSGRPYIDRLSANTRQQIRRSMRGYEQRGPLRATRARTVPEAMEYLAGLAELHQRYWIARGHPGAFSFPFFVRFQNRLIENCLPAGEVELMRVTCGDQAIGYLYNLVRNGHVYSYQSGFRYETDQKLKPGLISHGMCIDQHVREGALLYDFMAGEARYKASLADPGPDLIYVLLQRQTLALRLESALRRVKTRISG